MGYIGVGGGEHMRISDRGSRLWEARMRTHKKQWGKDNPGHMQPRYPKYRVQDFQGCRAGKASRDVLVGLGPSNVSAGIAVQDTR